MARVISTYSLHDALKFEGIDMPDDCVDVTLEFKVDNIYQLIYRCNLTDEMLQKVGRALQRLGEKSIEARFKPVQDSEREP